MYERTDHTLPADDDPVLPGKTIHRCPPDAWEGVPLSWAVNRVLEHCGHLGISADTMNEVMRGEQR